MKDNIVKASVIGGVALLVAGGGALIARSDDPQEHKIPETARMENRDEADGDSRFSVEISHIRQIPKSIDKTMLKTLGSSPAEKIDTCPQGDWECLR